MPDHFASAESVSTLTWRSMHAEQVWYWPGRFVCRQVTRRKQAVHTLTVNAWLFTGGAHVYKRAYVTILETKTGACKLPLPKLNSTRHNERQPRARRIRFTSCKFLPLGASRLLAKSDVLVDNSQRTFYQMRLNISLVDNLLQILFHSTNQRTTHYFLVCKKKGRNNILFFGDENLE